LCVFGLGCALRSLRFPCDVLLPSAVLFFEVMVLTGPLIDNMLSADKQPLAVSFGKALAAACGATFLLVASGFLVRLCTCCDPAAPSLELVVRLLPRVKFCD
jgi:hypothetical protein